MPRKERKLLPNTTYHTMSRCIQWRSLMRESFIKDIMIQILKRTEEIYSYKLISYAIMDNHFHFIIQTIDDGETISRIMQYIKARFAERFNKMSGRIGPFWNERFKDIIIEDAINPFHYLNWLLWYLGYNPVKKGIVRDPRNYQYSAINCYLDENYKSPIKITLHKYFLLLGKNFKERLKNFLFYEAHHQKKAASFFVA